MKEREQLFIPQIESCVKVPGDINLRCRRRFLQAASIGAAGLALPTRVAGISLTTNVRSCILLVMVGGPSHLDTFDMKPDAPAEVRGPFRPIRTNVPGIEISEIFPRTSKHADKFALLRSLHHTGAADHTSGLELLETGRCSTDTAHARLSGTARRLGEGVRNDSSEQSPDAAKLSPTEAVKILKSLPAFDPQRYGDTEFGRNCHRAMKMVAGGARFVTVDMFDTLINADTWDIHGSRPFSPISAYRDHVGPMFDHAYSALLEDLKRSGLLESTFVVATGEFGRTPYINPCGGRDHWPHCWTALFAGGGVRGGQVVGASDRIGAYVRERPTTPADVVSTIYHTLGIAAFPLVPEGAKPILELF